MFLCISKLVGRVLRVTHEDERKVTGLEWVNRLTDEMVSDP